MKEECWHLPSMLPPKHTHVMLTPFSVLSFGPVWWVCLFWLSLKHTQTIAAILPAPSFHSPMAVLVWVDRCWDVKTECCQQLYQTILGYLTSEKKENRLRVASCLKKSVLWLAAFISAASAHVHILNTRRTNDPFCLEAHEITETL